MSVSGGPDGIENGLVLTLDAANVKSYPGSGTTWNDLSGNNRNGTLTNGPVFNSTAGGNILFDGVDDFVNVGFPAITGNNPFSVGFWIRPSSTGTPLFLGNTVANSAMLFYWTTTQQKVRIGVWASDKLESNTLILTNTWGYSFWTWDGTTIRSYTNGVADGSATGFSFNISNVYMTIGNAFNIQYFGGNIASVIIYNRVLSSQEILQNFNATRSRFGI